jgi:multicomponent Na+:H+ antiporter subunit G
MLESGWSVPTVKLCFILVFLLITSPTATHALAKTALDCGAEPTPYPYEER